MSKVCARPECGAPATARFFFDAKAKLVVLDAKIDEWGGSGALCPAHADRLSPPRGWALDDRRAAQARLFNVGRFEDTHKAAPARGRRLITPSAHPTTPLPLDGGPSYDLPEGYVAAAEHPAPARAPRTRAKAARTHAEEGAPHAEHDPAGSNTTSDDALGATPILDRAFEAAESKVKPTSTLASLFPRAVTG